MLNIAISNTNILQGNVETCLKVTYSPWNILLHTLIIIYYRVLSKILFKIDRHSTKLQQKLKIFPFLTDTASVQRSVAQFIYGPLKGCFITSQRHRPAYTMCQGRIPLTRISRNYSMNRAKGHPLERQQLCSSYSGLCSTHITLLDNFALVVRMVRSIPLCVFLGVCSATLERNYL